jgi:hypothetical protein
MREIRFTVAQVIACAIVSAAIGALIVLNF